MYLWFEKNRQSKDISQGEIGLNGLHRKYLYVSYKDLVVVKEFETPKSSFILSTIKFQVDFRSKSVKGLN